MNVEFQRQRFLEAKSDAKSIGKGAPQASKIRIVVPLVDGKNVYDFDVKDNKGHKTNYPLKDNDMFVAAMVAFGYMVEDDLLPGHAPTVAYPLQASAALTAVGLKGLTANAHGYVLYNGAWSLRTNQEVNFSQFPMSHFLNVPKSEAAGVVGSNIRESAFELPEKVELSGKQDHYIRVEIPGTKDTAIKSEAGAKAYLVMEMYGWTVQGGAK